MVCLVIAGGASPSLVTCTTLAPLVYDGTVQLTATNSFLLKTVGVSLTSVDLYLIDVTLYEARSPI